MKLLVGLGNPGLQYDKTRHNAGFMVIDRVLKRHGPGALARSRFSALAYEIDIAGERCMLLKPTTYMNLSGRSVGEAVGFYKLDPSADLLVVMDDVALPTGTIRLRASGSAGGHNGLTDVQRALGTDVYPRLRVGVDARPAHMALEDYVLGRFTPEQAVLLEPALERAADAAEMFVKRGLTPAMNTFNAKLGGESDPPEKPPPGREPA